MAILSQDALELQHALEPYVLYQMIIDDLTRLFLSAAITSAQYAQVISNFNQQWFYAEDRQELCTRWLTTTLKDVSSVSTQSGYFAPSSVACCDQLSHINRVGRV